MKPSRWNAGKAVLLSAVYIVILALVLLLPYLTMKRMDPSCESESIRDAVMQMGLRGKFSAWDAVPEKAVVQRIVRGKMFALAEGHFYSGQQSRPFTVVLWKNLFNEGYRLDGRYCISGLTANLTVTYLPMKATLSNGLQELAVKTAFNPLGCVILALMIASHAVVLWLLKASRANRKPIKAVLALCIFLLFSLVLPYLEKPKTDGGPAYRPLPASVEVQVESREERSIHFPGPQEASRIVEYYNQLFPLLAQAEPEAHENWKYRIVINPEESGSQGRTELKIYENGISYDGVLFSPLNQITMEEILSAAENQFSRAKE